MFDHKILELILCRLPQTVNLFPHWFRCMMHNSQQTDKLALIQVATWGSYIYNAANHTYCAVKVSHKVSNLILFQRWSNWELWAWSSATHMYEYLLLCVCVHAWSMCSCVHAYLLMCVCVCVYICACASVQLYLCICSVAPDPCLLLSQFQWPLPHSGQWWCSWPSLQWTSLSVVTVPIRNNTATAHINWSLSVGTYV